MCQALTKVNKGSFSLPSRSLHSSMEKQTINKIDMLIYCLLGDDNYSEKIQTGNVSRELWEGITMSDKI